MQALDRLALDGGAPIRTEPLDHGKGVAFLGDEERDAVLRVLESRSLFRYYGPDLQGTVAAFEAAACDTLDVLRAGQAKRIDVESMNRLDHLKLKSTY